MGALSGVHVILLRIRSVPLAVTLKIAVLTCNAFFFFPPEVADAVQITLAILHIHMTLQLLPCISEIYNTKRCFTFIGSGKSKLAFTSPL